MKTPTRNINFKTPIRGVFGGSLVSPAKAAKAPAEISRDHKDPSTMPAAQPQAHSRGADPAPKLPAAPQQVSKFRSFGEQMQAIARQEMSGNTDNRLVRQPGPSGLNATDPIQGGFLIDADFMPALNESIYPASVVFPLIDQRDTDNPLASAVIPAIDETSRATGSRYGGTAAGWVDGGFNTLTSLPKWKALKFGGHKLISLSIVTNELMADVTMLGSHLKKAFAAEFGFLIDQAIVSGTGAGVPLGILNSAALIKVAKQSGQAAGTILAENVRDMWARMPLASRRNAVWLVSEDAMSQLDSPDASGFTGIFQPSGVASSAVPLLKGRPVLEIEQASALGTVGDIILVDPTQYITVSNKLRADFSVDFQFNNDQSVFRFTWRIDGKPASSSPITPFNGTVTRSPFVALAAR